MPDANKNATLNQLVGAAFGAAGQRCMALPIGIFVGEAREWIPDLLAMAKVSNSYCNENIHLKNYFSEINDRHLIKNQDLKTGPGHLPGVDVGPLISPAAKKYVTSVIDSAVADGCNLLLDGRNCTVPGYEQGNFVGPTIITGAQTHMRCYQVNKAFFNWRQFFFIFLGNFLLDNVRMTTVCDHTEKLLSEFGS